MGEGLTVGRGGADCGGEGGLTVGRGGADCGEGRG